MSCRICRLPCDSAMARGSCAACSSGLASISVMRAAGMPRFCSRAAMLRPTGPAPQMMMSWSGADSGAVALSGCMARASGRSHQRFDIRHLARDGAGQDVAAVRRDMRVVFDADADVPVFFRDACCWTHVDAWLDREYHAGLQCAPGFVAVAAGRIAILADVMHIHAQPVAGTVHVELVVVALGDDVVEAAGLVSVEQAGVE